MPARRSSIPRAERLSRRYYSGRSTSTHLRSDRKAPRKWKYRLWYCDNCGPPLVMNSYINEQCSECQHCRCKYCRVELVELVRIKYAKYFPEHHPAQENPMPIDNPTLREVTGPKLSFPEKKLDIPETSAPSLLVKNRSTPSEPIPETCQNPDAQENVNGSPSTQIAIQNMHQDRVLASTPPSPSSVATTSPTSTPESAVSRELLKYQDQDAGSETELESDDEELEEDMTDSEAVDDYLDSVIAELDSRLFSVLGYDLELAARLIPLIHAQLQFGRAPDGAEFTTIPTQETPGTAQSGEVTANASSIFVGSPNESRQHKRGRQRDESEDRGDNDDSKGRRKRSDRRPWQGPGFACPFYKKDPTRYCSLNHFKFRVCMGPGFPELRRIKGHFDNVHRVPQCERCYDCFNDREELKQHRRARPCLQMPENYKEGIDDSQMEKIQEVLKVKRGTSKQRTDYDKWYDMWEIIFPGLDRPAHPWIESTQRTMIPPTRDPEAFLAIFNSILEDHYEQGTLERNSKTHQLIERAVRLAFDLQREVSAMSSSLTAAPLENDNSGQINDEQSSHPSAAAIHLDSYPTGDVQTIGGPASFLPQLQHHLKTATDLHILELGALQTQNPPIGSHTLESPIHLLGTHTAQPWQGVTSATDVSDLAAPLAEPAGQQIEPNIDLNQEFLGSITDVNLAGFMWFETFESEPFEKNSLISAEHQNFVMLPEVAQSDSSDAVLSMDTSSNALTSILELENEHEDATGPWTSKHDGKRGPRRPPRDKERAL